MSSLALVVVVVVVVDQASLGCGSGIGRSFLSQRAVVGSTRGFPDAEEDDGEDGQEDQEGCVLWIADGKDRDRSATCESDSDSGTREAEMGEGDD